MDKCYKKNFIWNMLGITLNSFAVMLYLIIVTRINGIAVSGEFSFAFAFCAIIQVIATFGGRNYQITDVDEECSDREYLSSTVITIALSILITVIYFFCFKTNTTKIVFISLLLIIKFIEAFSERIFAVFQKENRLDFVGKSYLLKTSLSLLALLIIDYVSENLTYSILAMVVINIAVFICFDLKKFGEFQTFKIQLTKKTMNVLKKSSYFFAFAFLTLLIANISRFTIEGLLNESDLGYYGILVMIPSVMTLFGQFIINPSMLILTRSNHELDFKKFDHEVKKIFMMIFVLACVCIICAYFFGEYVLSLLYNISFKGYKGIFVIFIITGLLNVCTFIISNLLTIMRRTKVQVLLYFIVLVFGILVSYFFTKVASFDGAVFGYCVTMLIQFVIFLVCYGKVLQSRLST